MISETDDGFCDIDPCPHHSVCGAAIFFANNPMMVPRSLFTKVIMHIVTLCSCCSTAVSTLVRNTNNTSSADMSEDLRFQTNARWTDATYWPFQTSRTCTVWLAIDDADEENAAMQFVSGSHRAALPWYALWLWRSRL